MERQTITGMIIFAAFVVVGILIIVLIARAIVKHFGKKAKKITANEIDEEILFEFQAPHMRRWIVMPNSIIFGKKNEVVPLESIVKITNNYSTDPVKKMGL